MMSNFDFFSNRNYILGHLVELLSFDCLIVFSTDKASGMASFFVLNHRDELFKFMVQNNCIETL